MGQQAGSGRSCGDSPAAVLDAVLHLDDAAAASRPALSRRCIPADRPGRLTFAEAAARSAGWAAELIAAGVGPGDRVALLAESSPDWVVAFLGVLWTGAIAVPLDPKLTTDELAPILADAAPSAVIAGAA